MLTCKFKLKSALSQKTEGKPKLKIEGDLYYTEDGDGPFCTACFDSKDKLVRVSPMGTQFHVIAKFRCNVCKGHYHGSQ